jgi:hypothetical protein
MIDVFDAEPKPGFETQGADPAEMLDFTFF